MIEKVETLAPRKGTFFNLIVFAILLSFWLGLLFSTIYSVLFANDPYVGYQKLKDFGYFLLIVFFFIPVSLFLVYEKIGATIIISKNGISKPMKIKKRKPKFILYDNMLWYMKKYSPLTDEVDSVLIMTRQNRKVIYHDILTPGCVNAIIEKLQEHGIEERFPSTGREKYGR